MEIEGDAVKDTFCIPFPVVLSADGPVPVDGVPPFFRIQSNLSFVSWRNPHMDVSKLQPKAKQVQEKKLKIIRINQLKRKAASWWVVKALLYWSTKSWKEW